MASAVIDQLHGRLTEVQLARFEELLEEARRAQARDDAEEVARLVRQLASGEESAQAGAASQIRALGPRVVSHLVTEMGAMLDAQQLTPALESSMLALLAELAPDLNGYDPAFERERKRALLDEWLRALSGRGPTTRP
jgi:hypothetical protein